MSAHQHYWKVFKRVCAQKTLSDAAKNLVLSAFLCALTGSKRASVPEIPLPINIGLKTRYLALNELVDAKLAFKVKKADGWHCVPDLKNPLFKKPKEKQTLENFNPVREDSVTTFTLQTAWYKAYREIFRAEPKKDQKDLVRFRFVIRKQGGTAAMQAVQDFFNKHRNAPHKATTLAFYCQYGKTKH